MYFRIDQISFTKIISSFLKLEKVLVTYVDVSGDSTANEHHLNGLGRILQPLQLCREWSEREGKGDEK